VLHKGSRFTARVCEKRKDRDRQEKENNYKKKKATKNTGRGGGERYVTGCVSQINSIVRVEVGNAVFCHMALHKGPRVTARVCNGAYSCNDCARGDE
jgi:hypothetical protein